MTLSTSYIVEQLAASKQAVFTLADLCSLWDSSTMDTLSVANDLVKQNVLVEAVEAEVFVYEQADSFGFQHIREQIALMLRRGENMYVSMQTVLSDLQIISQIANALIVVTDGKSEVVKTPYGYINFYHSDRPMSHIHADTTMCKEANNMRIAGPVLALSDLRKILPEEVSTVDFEEYEDTLEEIYNDAQVKKIAELIS